MNNKNDDNIQVNFLENNSIDSIDDDFQTSGKYLHFNSDTNRIETVNQKVNLAKKNTKNSSNNDEDGENENINNNHDKKIANYFDIQLSFSGNNKYSKKSKNENMDDKYDSHNNVINVTNYKNTTCEDNKINNIKMSNFSENNLHKIENILYLKNTEESINSNGIKDDKKLKPISKNKNKNEKLLILEEKNKYKSPKKRLYTMEENEEKKDEKKKVRRDKNGVQICKRNRKKVKISFEIPFEIITPVESYKQYNVILEIPNEENYMKECQCCSLI